MSNWESTQTLQASAAQSSSSAGSAVDLGTRDRLLRQTLSITAVSGSSPVLTVRLEASPDGVDAWKTFGQFMVSGASGSEKLSFVSPERFVRAVWVIAGAGASFTFAVTGTKGISFANLDHLEGLGIPAVALGTVTPSKRVEQLAATTEVASGILAGRYTLPIVGWGIDLSQACAKIAAYELLSVRGLNPDGDDKNVRDRYDDAMKWLSDAAAGRISPVGLIDSTPEEVDDGGAEIVTLPARGWR